MDNRIESLSREAVFDIVHDFVVWSADRSGPQILAVYSELVLNGALEQKWLRAEKEDIDDDKAKALKTLLSSVLTGNDKNAVAWLDAELNAYETTGQGHSVLAGLAISGVIAVALVLAARVKKIGTVEFYEGVPPEVAEIVEKVKSTPLPGLGSQ